jgi:hypothetical protein
MKVKLHNACEFKGQHVILTQDVSCLEDVKYTNLEEHGIMISGKMKNLKKNSKPVEEKITFEIFE